MVWPSRFSHAFAAFGCVLLLVGCARSATARDASALPFLESIALTAEPGTAVVALYSFNDRSLSNAAAPSTHFDAQLYGFSVAETERAPASYLRLSSAGFAALPVQLGEGPTTMGAWIRVDEGVGEGSPNGGNPRVRSRLILGESSRVEDGLRGLFLSLDEAGRRARLAAVVGPGVTVEHPGVVADGRWHLVAVAYEGTRVRVRLDEHEVIGETQFGRGGPGDVKGALFVGGDGRSPAGLWGSVDDVFVLNGAVPAEAFAELLAGRETWASEDEAVLTASSSAGFALEFPQEGTAFAVGRVEGVPAWPSASLAVWVFPFADGVVSADEDTASRWRQTLWSVEEAWSLQLEWDPVGLLFRLRLQWECGFATDGRAQRVWHAPPSIRGDAWNWVVVRWDALESRVSVRVNDTDVVVDHTPADCLARSRASGHWRVRVGAHVGARASTASDGFVGRLDEMHVWSRRLVDSELDALSRHSVGAWLNEGLVASWTFPEGRGPVTGSLTLSSHEPGVRAQWVASSAPVDDWFIAHEHAETEFLVNVSRSHLPSPSASLTALPRCGALAFRREASGSVEEWTAVTGQRVGVPFEPRATRFRYQPQANTDCNTESGFDVLRFETEDGVAGAVRFQLELANDAPYALVEGEYLSLSLAGYRVHDRDADEL